MTDQATKNRIWDVVSSLRVDASLVNIKFFLGSERNITQADLCEASAHALRQIQLGAVVPVAAFDKDMPQRPFAQI